LNEAIEQKQDCYITGTADEAAWSLAQEEGICVMAFGHYATEKRGIYLLGEHLKKQFDVEHIFIPEKNPF
jgi:putative NIF3 family GTP cyclohydrolase 1 type 2